MPHFLKKLKNEIRRFYIRLKIKTRIAFKKRKIIYIINNYPTKAKPERIIRLENIIRINFPEVRVKTIHFSEINYYTLKNSKGLILTGSSLNVSTFYKDKNMEYLFRKELELIKIKYNEPIFAICFGHQLAAYAFNSKVKRMNYRVVNNDVSLLQIRFPDELIPHERVYVNLNHKDYVDPFDFALRENFKIIATLTLDNYKTVQYMRHKKRPIYSVQFHPENHIGNYHYPLNISDEIIDKAKIAGEKIITDFVKLCL
jgi:GMP synthase-like glutamine amidotransferase